MNQSEQILLRPNYKRIGLLFNTEMAIANIHLTKTETRRLHRSLNHINQYADDYVVGTSYIKDGELYFPVFEKRKADPGIAIKSPYGQVGDLMWQRETYLFHPIPVEGYKYKSDMTKEQLESPIFKDKILKWKPSIHMPKAACRYMAPIIDVQLDRLYNIDAQGAINEGISYITHPASFKKPQFNYKNYMFRKGDTVATHFSDPVESFLSLWEATYGIENTHKNPWVFVIKYANPPILL